MFKAIMKDNRGSYTLEATIVLPVILLIFFSLVFYAMHLYQKLVIVDTATYTSSQVASNWDNSYKDTENSLLPTMDNDGLYWRIIGDRSSSALAVKKLNYGKNFAEASMESATFKTAVQADPVVSVQYDNKLISRGVTTEISSDLFTPTSPLIRSMMGNNINVKVRSDVAEPAEFIRTCDITDETLSQLLEFIKNYAPDSKPAPEKINLVASAYPYDKNRKNKIYHYEGCYHIESSAYKIHFNSVEEAKQQGYHLCKDCASKKYKELLIQHTTGK